MCEASATAAPFNRISAAHSGLKCVNLNARSIVFKRDELRRMADIIGIAETWTKPDMGDAEFGLAGYKMVRKNRLVKRGGRGGGGGGGGGGRGGGGRGGGGGEGGDAIF